MNKAEAIAWVEAQLKDARDLKRNTERRLMDIRSIFTEEGRKYTVTAVETILPTLRQYVSRLEATLERLKREEDS